MNWMFWEASKPSKCNVFDWSSQATTLWSLMNKLWPCPFESRFWFPFIFKHLFPLLICNYFFEKSSCKNPLWQIGFLVFLRWIIWFSDYCIHPGPKIFKRWTLHHISHAFVHIWKSNSIILGLIIWELRFIHSAARYA